MNIILDAIEDHVVHVPDNIALTGSHCQLTWQQLHMSISHFSNELEKTQTFGLLLGNSVAWVIGDLAAALITITCVPIPTFFSAQQVEHCIVDSGIELVLTDTPDKLTGFTKNYRTFELGGQKLYLVETAVSTQTIPRHISKITYTSGTTGSPKGVLLTARQISSVVNSLAWASKASRNDRALTLMPLSTLLENIASVYVPLLVGAQSLIPDAEQLGLKGSSQIDIQALSSSLNGLKPSTIILPPQLLGLFIQLADKQLLPNSFRFIAVGGAPVSRNLLTKAEAAGLPVFQGYGLSEATSVVTLNTPENNRTGSVGQPLPHCSVSIADDGEILISGLLFNGYLNQKRVVDEVVRTGDIGHIDDDGYLYVTGRKKNLIVTSYSRNISPEWVEAELQSENVIHQAAVFGNNQAFLMAVINGENNTNEQDFTQAIDSVNERLPDYAQVKKYHIGDQQFSVSNQQLSIAGQPQRENIFQHYEKAIAACYEV